MNRTVLIALIILLIAGCSEEVLYDEVRVIVSGNDQCRIEYLANEQKIENGDTACVPVARSELAQTESLSEAINLITEEDEESPCVVERDTLSMTVECDTSTKFRAMSRTIQSLAEVHLSDLTLIAYQGADSISTEIELPIEVTEMEARIRLSDVLRFLIDESNNHWFIWGHDEPVAFDPFGGDSLLHLLLHVSRANPRTMLIFNIHPNSNLTYSLNVLDNVSSAEITLNEDSAYVNLRKSRTPYSFDSAGMYHIGSVLQAWTNREERVLERYRLNAPPVAPTSTTRNRPARKVRWPSIWSPPDISPPLDVMPVLPDTSAKYERHVIVIDNDTFPDFDQFVPVEEPPQPIDLPDPEYPEKAIQAGTGGEVWINALVDKHGVVRKAMVIKEPGLGLGFGEAAQQAAMKGKWSPALQNGYPVAYWVKYKVEFKFPPDDNDLK